MFWVFWIRMRHHGQGTFAKQNHHEIVYMSKPDVVVMECSRKKVINLSRYVQNIPNPTEQQKTRHNKFTYNIWVHIKRYFFSFPNKILLMRTRFLALHEQCMISLLKNFVSNMFNQDCSTLRERYWEAWWG